MDKKLLKEFAIFARNELRRQISLRAAAFGVTSKGVAALHIGSDYVEMNNEKYPLKYKKAFEKLIHQVQTKGYENVIEEAAYTWFNRLAALRYMEVHDYLPSRIRVLSSETKGKIDPDILTEYRHADLPENIVNEVSELLGQNHREQAYRNLLVAQCNELHTIMPFLFEKVADFTELLLPESLLHSDSLINKFVNDLEDSHFEEVEVIGWLYQYYMSERKEQVGGLKNTAVNKEDLPVVTQLFTPKWIVQYMVQNSLGKLYDEWKPGNELALEWEYYLKSPEPLPIPTISKLEEIKIIDPACGSGHILIYAFDLMYDMYAEAGYRERDIPQLILENNLYGIDIDKRAMQLASFALMMKGQEKNRRFLRKADKIKLNILEFIDSENISEEALLFLKNHISDTAVVEEVIALFENAKQFGSLLEPQQSASFYRAYIDVIENLDVTTVDLINESYIYELQEKLLPILKQAQLLAMKYEVVVANPPYHNKYNPVLKEYMEKNYPDFKSDMYSAFIYRGTKLVNENSFVSLMTPFTWMFIITHEKLRNYIITNYSVSSLIQLEYSAFKEATVPICTFTIHNQRVNTKGEYVRLTHFIGETLQPEKVKEAVKNPSVLFRYTFDCELFKEMPSMQFAYWSTEKVRFLFNHNPNIGDVSDVKVGLQTGEDARFLRFWSEVDFNSIGFNKANSNEAMMSQKKWFPFNKGGFFRKWYGNNQYIVNWENDGQELKEFNKSVLRNVSYYFEEGITWGLVSSGAPSFRYSPPGFIPGHKGSMIYIKNKNYFHYCFGILNSNIVVSLMEMIAPNIGFEVSSVKSIPIANEKVDSTLLELIDHLVVNNIQLSKKDWDTFETSWDFDSHQFLSNRQNEITLESCYKNWETQAESQFQQLKENEEELNRTFIELYGLQEELTPEIPDEDIKIRRADRERDAKSFLSYCVGLMMGRYSLDEEGLAYAGGDWNHNKYVSFQPDEDGILPLTENVYFEDDVVSRLEDILVTIFGEEILAENLRWLAESLKMKTSETPVERLRRYFFEEFFKDHCKINSKRPIYWLLDSGKKKGFRALVYLHRYNTETLAKVRFQYVQDLQEKLRAEQRRLEQDLLNPDLSTAMKKRYEKHLTTIKSQQEELITFDKKLAELANQRIALDLDDGIVVNYAKLQDILAKI